MKKINVLYTVWGMSYGGAERFVINLISGIDTNRFNIIVFSDNSSIGPLQQDFEKYGAKVIYAKYHRYKHPFKYFLQLRRVISNNSIDIIHANDDLNMIFPLLAKSARVKFIAHSHCTSFRFTKSKTISRLATAVLSKYISRHADLRFGCSKLACEALFGNRRSFVIPNIVDIERFKYSSKRRILMRNKYNIKKEIVWLNVGRLVEEKNQLFLLHVFREYLNTNNSSKLFIIGDGPMKDRLVEEVRRLGLVNNVYILPPTNNISDYYNLSDLFIMTSLFEGMPVVSVEAQLNGLKCVFSDSITPEADHSGSSVFLPINRGAEYWSKEILAMDISRSILRNDEWVSSFDGSKVSKSVSDKYIKLVKGVFC